MVSFVILLLIVSYAINRGEEKVRPKFEATQNRIAEQADLLKNLIARDLEDMGVRPDRQEGSITEMLEEMMSGTGLQSMISRPIGTWIGVRKSGSSRYAFIKFEKDEYWLKTKDDSNRDLLEKGDYKYGIVEIVFYPENKESYTMQYERVSPDYIQLFGDEISYNLEKSEDIGFNF